VKRVEKLDSWPVVVENDDGIRPAGAPDECFYCHKKVGEAHGLECVTVLKQIEVTVSFRYKKFVPHFWDDNDVIHHHDLSSSCASNLLHEIERAAEESGQGCPCGTTETTVLGVVDNGPFRTPPQEVNQRRRKDN
jgi:hypothetical protein